MPSRPASVPHGSVRANAFGTGHTNGRVLEGAELGREHLEESISASETRVDLGPLVVPVGSSVLVACLKRTVLPTLWSGQGDIMTKRIHYEGTWSWSLACKGWAVNAEITKDIALVTCRPCRGTDACWAAALRYDQVMAYRKRIALEDAAADGVRPVARPD